MLLPFLVGGCDAGEPTLVALGERDAALIRSALPPGPDVSFLAGGAVYARPTVAICSYRRLLAEHVAAGAQQIDLVSYLSEQRPARPDPVRAGRPVIDLTAPSAAAARAAVRTAGSGILGVDDLEDLLVAVSEAVTSATVHGRAPAGMRVWTGADRVVVAVTDGGAGLKDPFAGLLPATDRAIGGRGLWIIHQFRNRVVTHVSSDTFTLRMTAGNPAEPTVGAAGQRGAVVQVLGVVRSRSMRCTQLLATR